MTLELDDFSASDTNYVSKINGNNAAIESAINSLAAQVSAVGGDGAQLLLDLFDRAGLMGAHSYVLDLDTYAGGATIAIGRRPAPDAAKGETNISKAWGTFAGELQLVQMSGDATLNATAITSGLPKTIYVGIPSSGTPQLFESTSTPNIIYAYQMCWDGFQLTLFKRMAHLLPAYSLIQRMAAVPREVGVFDSETDFVSDETGMSQVTLPGAADDNEIGVDGSVEVLGFYVHARRGDIDGFCAPAGVDPDSVAVRFKVVDDADVEWTESDFEIDCSNLPDSVFRAVAGGVGDGKFVTEVKEFHLVRTHIGGNVVSARAFSWGLIVRPLLGPAIPKDTTKVEMV